MSVLDFTNTRLGLQIALPKDTLTILEVSSEAGTKGMCILPKQDTL